MAESWSETCTVEDCLTAARITGIYPFDQNFVLTNKYVHVLTEEEKLLKKRVNQRLNINENRDTIIQMFEMLTSNIVFISEYIENDTKYQLDSVFFIICLKRTLIFIQQNEIKHFYRFFTNNQKATIYFQSEKVRSKIEQLLNLQFQNSKEKHFSPKKFSRQNIKSTKNS